MIGLFFCLLLYFMTETMSLQARDYANLIFLYGKCNGNAAEAIRLYKQTYPPPHPTNSRVISNAFYRVAENRPVVPRTSSDDQRGGRSTALPPKLEENVLQYFDKHPRATSSKAGRRFGISHTAVLRILNMDSRYQSGDNNFKADRRNIHSLYRCSGCQVVFKKKHHLHSHINSMHSYETIYSCDYCQMKFTSKEYIQIHMKIKHARGSFECDQCEPNVYVCDYCGKTFTYKSNIISHLYKQTANTKCKICDASVKPGRMKRHVGRMHGNEEVQCEQCGEVVKSKYGFQQHVSHHGHIHDQRDRQTTGTCGERDQQSTCSKIGEESGEGTLPPEVNAVASASAEHQFEVFIKEEPANQELDLGPVVFQHIDCNYRPYKEEPLLD